MKTLSELPSFKLSAPGVPEDGAIEAYQRDGVVWIENAFSSDWVNLLAEGMEEAIRTGTDRDTVFNIAAPGEPGFFYYDTFMWQRIDAFRQFAFDSDAADIARNIMRSKGLIFYFDFMLVKEPGTSQKTPWHYDEAYWPVSGEQICNFWTSLDHIPLETALRFVKGSHLWEQQYQAVHFSPGMQYANLPDYPPPPDWDEEEGNFDMVYAPMKPGDCLVFNRKTFHSAPGNSLETTRRRALATHWIGDDITYNDKPQETDPPYRGENLAHGGSMECESFPRVR
jgi:ectoine hydroxylase-related dioxygenase (phytanoyl-CoA dioxygenase family)